MLKIEDIARKAGVSKTAVSFALNNKSGISAETREKILNIVRESGYSPKPLIKVDDMASDPKALLLLICSRTDITSVEPGIAPFYAELIRGIEKRSNELGYHLWLRSIGIDEKFRENAVTLLNDMNTSGVLLIATDMLPEDVETICSINKKIVALDSFFDYIDVNCVVMNSIQGSYRAAEYLMDLGHVDIGYIQSNKRIYNFEMRKKGFEAALAKKGLKLDPRNVYTVAPTIEATVAGVNVKIKENSKMPTAIFAENDYMAIGAIKCFANSGIRVPEDISVIGFDNIEAASLITPELTTIDVPKERMAYLAVDRMINMIENDSGRCDKDILAVELIERQSCRSIR